VGLPRQLLNCLDGYFLASFPEFLGNLPDYSQLHAQLSGQVRILMSRVHAQAHHEVDVVDIQAQTD
jgi:hypothetical protein